MPVVLLDHDADFDGWRAAARALLAAEIPSDKIIWQVAGGQADLLAEVPTPLPQATASFSVPRRFVELAESVICHRDPARFALLYQALRRLRGSPKLFEDSADPLVHRLEAMAKSVGRDIHKMRAFVRFREIEEDSGTRFVAWFEPEHHIVRRNAGFFTRRFASMRWSILTPELCVHWDGDVLDFTPGATRADAPGGDPLEETWRTYYASIFNPARLKVKAMTKEMPKKYWRNMPETALVPSLIAAAGTRTTAMIAQAALPVADERYDSLAAVRAAANHCTRCPLYKDATQMVFGEGPADAKLMFVGEQPGDQEDLAGRPFVGPAGQKFNEALADAGIDRDDAYVTNAVKHFKFEPRGKRRLHKSPNAGEIDACRFWVDHERSLVKPRLVVALGATAARSLLGKATTISSVRGAPIDLADGSEAWVTIHPSFLLRQQDEASEQVEYARFVDDLRNIKSRLAALA
ncbi:UdgX family uracil-DNA binding protein [Sphingoaurantiacus capsulatus]|uniref:Type-4 uracil-DNA glycosylase n=1 Tax=Sphingoaurantiacus capsulatus TaxID=1771310 RepID=A0ABV7X8C7_9SPHN